MSGACTPILVAIASISDWRRAFELFGLLASFGPSLLSGYRTIRAAPRRHARRPRCGRPPRAPPSVRTFRAAPITTDRCGCSASSPDASPMLVFSLTLSDYLRNARTAEVRRDLASLPLLLGCAGCLLRADLPAIAPAMGRSPTPAGCRPRWIRPGRLPRSSSSRKSPIRSACSCWVFRDLFNDFVMPAAWAAAWTRRRYAGTVSGPMNLSERRRPCRLLSSAISSPVPIKLDADVSFRAGLPVGGVLVFLVHTRRSRRWQYHFAGIAMVCAVPFTEIRRSEVREERNSLLILLSLVSLVSR